MKSKSDSYRLAGVDINAGYRAVELIKESVARTRIPGVMSDIGGFGGLFAPDLGGLRRPVLVSATDGVGTKLKLAFLMDRHDIVGIDCVAMCVNDIICSGARPLFFLDYLALGRNVPERVAAIVSGVAEGCVQAGCALIGGETAEMPGFYPEDEYDLAGFAVGMVDEGDILDRGRVRAGDLLIGLPSSGLHSNGFSLARKALDVERIDLRAPLKELGDVSLGDALLAPTRIYVRPALELLREGLVKSIAHITGGGFFENLPRALPDGLRADVDTASWSPHAIFDLLAERGGIPMEEMFSTFNMGVGMCAVTAPEHGDEALAILSSQGEAPFPMGRVSEGSEGVRLCG